MGATPAATLQRYAGPDRRHRRVFVTRNSEYHCRDGVCVAVRDRRTQEFFPNHDALGQTVSSSIRFSADGGIETISLPEETQVGEKVCFSMPEPKSGAEEFCEHGQLITSEVKAIERPAKATISQYPRLVH